jgi:hypothetical protein
MRVHTEILIDIKTAEAMLDDTQKHGAEYVFPANGQEGELIFDSLVFRIAPAPRYKKRLRARIFPSRWWK